MVAVLLAGLLPVGGGCSRHASRLSGTVSLDGVPLTTGVITLTPVQGGSSAYAAIGADGTYRMHTGAAAGLDPGEYLVMVAANAAGSTGGEAPGNRGTLPLITPPEYADKRLTPLRATIQPGSQVIDFDLKSTPKKSKR